MTDDRKSNVLKAILKREQDGLALNSTAVLRQDRVLYNAIRREFSSWDQAMRAAGIDPEGIRNHRRWSRQAVVNRIRQLARQGKDLNSHAIQRSEATLISAASRLFLSWDEALECAGIDPEAWRMRVPTWTRERVIEAIQTIHGSGGNVSHTVLKRNSVTHAGCLLFGSWDDALRAAGLVPEQNRIRRRPWTPDEVVQEIQRKSQAGEPLNARDVSPHSLRSRGTEFFGSWDAALTAAGLDSARIRRSKTRGNRRCRSQRQRSSSSVSR